MVLLTKDAVTKIERVCALNLLWNVLKFIYVLAMVGVCAYASYKNSYGIFYHRIVSFTLTANLIWVFFDLFYNPLKDILGIIRERKR